MRYCVMYDDGSKMKMMIRLQRLEAGLCPLHDDAFLAATGRWVVCPRRDCGILGLRQMNGGVELAPGWRFLCEATNVQGHRG